MYLTMDIAAPIQSSYISNLRFKTEFLRYWPRKTIFDAAAGRDIEVFDSLMFYYHEWAVIGLYDWHNADTHRRIYSSLGTSATEIFWGGYPWEGVQAAFMFLKPFDIDRRILENYALETYIQDNSVLDKEYIVEMKYSEVVTGQSIYGLDRTDPEDELKKIATQPAEIEAMILGGIDSVFHTITVPNSAEGTEKDLGVYRRPKDEWELPIQDDEGDYPVREVEPAGPQSASLLQYNIDDNPVTFCSLLDTNDEIFERIVESVYITTVVPTYQEKKQTEFDDGIGFTGILDKGPTIVAYTITADVKYKFKRIMDPEHVNAQDTIDLITDAVNVMPQTGSSMYRQMDNMMKDIYPIVDDGDLIYTEPPAINFGAFSSSNNVVLTEYASSDVDDAQAQSDRKQYIRVGTPKTDTEDATGCYALEPRVFSILVGASMDTSIINLPNKYGDWKGLIIIATIVIAIILTFTLGPYIAASFAKMVSGALLTGTALTFTGFLVVFSLQLSLGIMVVGLVAKGISNQGNTMLAIVFSHAVVVLNAISTVLSYVTVLVGSVLAQVTLLAKIVIEKYAKGYGFLANLIVAAFQYATGGGATAQAGSISDIAADTSSTILEGVSGTVEAVVATVSDAIVSAYEMVTAKVVSYFTNTGLGEILADGTAFLNTAGNAYMAMIAPEPNPGFPESEDAEIPVDAEMPNKLSADFAAGNQFEQLQAIDTSYYTLTQGTIDKATTQLYS